MLEKGKLDEIFEIITITFMAVLTRMNIQIIIVVGSEITKSC